MKTHKTYQQMEEELNNIMQRIEEDSYDSLDALMSDYDKGVKLVDLLQSQLETAINKIKIIKK